tara:strand:+ start:283 stop:849 length:567 start_codon:yes stop_codon:yes gene_type:complete
MVTELKDYIKCYDGLVEDSFCKSIVKLFDETDHDYVDRQQRPSFHELNITQKYKAKDEAWMKIQIRLQKLFTDAVQLYLEDLDVAADFPAKYAFEEYRLKMYGNNTYDQFKNHVDVQDYSSARRFVVSFLYLNDVLAGGQTDFPRLGYSIEPKCGRMLMFPANWQYRHAGLPPISDRKYIIGTYLHYL